jgi:glycosyltransferase involved in cell wall biosynthesis
MSILTTLHTNVLSPSVIIPYSLGLLNPKSKKQFFAAIAKHQEKFAQDNNININIIQTVYNGLDISSYSLNTQTLNNNYGLWLGRVKRKHDKGLKEAVITAEKAKSNLHIVAKIDDQEFFDTEIKPNMGKYCTIISNPQTLSKKNDLYGQASYFIYPVRWEEPFGFVFVEAMACGTPVIAFAKGAVPEVILDGKTGFVVNPSDDDIRGDWIIKKTGTEGLREAVERIHSMPENEYLQMRKNCREHVEKNFTIKRMAEEYENVYKKILSIDNSSQNLT